MIRISILLSCMITMIACNSTKQKDTQTSTTIDSTLQVKATSILENKLT